MQGNLSTRSWQRVGIYFDYIQKKKKVEKKVPLYFKLLVIFQVFCDG